MFASLLLSSAKACSVTSFYAALLLSACDTSSPESREPGRGTPAQQVKTTRPAPAARVATRVVRLTNDSLAGQPFGEEPTIDELLASGGKVVARKPFRNLHEANQVDTILQVRHQSNVFEFYRLPDKDLLRDATITNFQPAYGRRLRTRLQSAHRPATGTTDKVRIGDTERANYVSVTYQSGRLSAVHVEPYVD